jgi:hypothetical protein
MARIKRSHREVAASAAEKKRSIQQRISAGGRITQPASSALAATRGTGANSSETPRAEEGAASMCTRLGSTSRTYIKYVTVAMRDIDSGRPNIALLTELDNAVSKVLKRHLFSENVNLYALICMFTNRKLLIATY